MNDEAIYKLDKERLISDLKEIHSDLVEMYKDLFKKKCTEDEVFANYLNNQYQENGVKSTDKDKWNDNFCHRASYTLLNKILFIRICEDKGFMLNKESDTIMGQALDEHIGKKLCNIGLQKWTSLVTHYTLGELLSLAFDDMQKSYQKIALYKEDKYEKLNPTKEDFERKFKLKKSEYEKSIIYKFEELIAKVIEKLDTARYNFGQKTDGNILGDVYEKFMDRETRKAIGQFYTPDFVIEYILNNTVAEADVVENPFVKVLDPSCGSGHFLIMAYDMLKNKFLDKIDTLQQKYANDKYDVIRNGKIIRLNGNDYWKQENIHYHLLKNCIYGADIDSFAVQLTTINLLLKDLDNFTDEINIIECDSLIKWEDDYDWRHLKNQIEQSSISYSLKYKDITGLEITEDVDYGSANEILRLCEFWAQKYDYVVGNPPWISLSGKHEQEIKSLSYYLRKYEGNTYMPNLYEFFILRAMNLFKRRGRFSFITPDRLAKNEQFISLRKKMLGLFMVEKLIFEVDFPDVIADTMIFVIINDTMTDYSVKVGTIESTNLIDKLQFQKSEGCEFKYYKCKTTEEIIKKIMINSNPLGKICKTTSGFGGKSTAITSKRTMCDQIEVIKGESIDRFFVKSKLYFKFSRENITGRTTDINKLGYKEKILLRKTGDKIIACYDDSCVFPEQSLYFLYEIEKEYNPFYILGLLNSRLMDFCYMQEFVTNANSTPQIKKTDLDLFPICKITDNDYKKQEYIAGLCIEIIELRKEIECWDFKLNNEKTSILRNFLDLRTNSKKYFQLIEELDNLVFDVYCLNDKEKKFINEYHNLYYLSFEEFIGIVDIDEIYQRLQSDDYEKIAKDYKTSVINIFMLEEKIIGNDLSCLNYNKLYSSIAKYLSEFFENTLLESDNFINIENISKIASSNIGNFDTLIEIMKKEHLTLKTNTVLNEIFSFESDSWNAYIKLKIKDKQTKFFVKYYESNYYGFAEWTDEIHKKYFQDAFSRFTKTEPNEKKAKDILKLFKELDIKDKTDYIEIMEMEIAKVFR